MTANNPHPDTVRFLAQFDGPLTFQTFDDSPRKEKALSRILHGDCLPELLSLNGRGAGVFLMVNEGDGQGRGKENVTRIRAYPADFDGAPLPEVWPLEPSMLTETSPGKFHAYWILAEGESVPLDNNAWNAQVEAIAHAVGSEPNDCKGMNRVTRAPAFKHQKEEPFVSRLVSVTGQRYTLAQIQAAFPVAEKATAPFTVPTVPHTGQQDARKEVQRTYALKALQEEAAGLAAMPPDSGRNKKLYTAACRAGELVAGGHLDANEAQAALCGAAGAAGLVPNEIQGTFQSGFKTGLGNPDALTDVGQKVGKFSKGKKGEGGPADGDDGEGRRPPASTRVMEYAEQDGAEFWHDQHGTAFVTVSMDGHREHYRLPSRSARDYIQALYYGREQRALNGQAQAEVLGLMQAIARRQGQQYPTGIRVMHLDGFTYLDLGTPTWEAVEVGRGYWKVIKPHECPVRFTRPAGFLALPEPVVGGTLTELGEYLNTDRRGLMMCTAWLVAAVSGMKPFPVLAFSGEQGTGKSTAASVLKNLFDPSQADRRRAPKEERDLYVAAASSYALSLDNLSSIPAWLSDGLCCLSTGAAFAARTLYSDSEETILEAARPVIVNGIPDLLARPDLAERALTVTLHRIPGEKRLTERDFWARYERARPRLLGALLTALAECLRNLEATHLEESPRLADFARLIVAGEAALPWTPGEFLTEYTNMQSETAVSVLEGEPVADALKAFIEAELHWEGTVKKLLGILGEREYGETRPPVNWPKSSRGMGATLRRLAPALSKTGYMVTHLGRSHDGERYALSKSRESTFTTYTTFTEAVPDAINPVNIAKPNVHTPAPMFTPAPPDPASTDDAPLIVEESPKPSKAAAQPEEVLTW